MVHWVFLISKDKHMRSRKLTLDSKREDIANGCAHEVGGNACIISSRLSSHQLQDESLVAKNDSSRNIML